MSNFEEVRTDDYPQLSRPFESMKPDYDVVVVGSGYGAGVAASRMARAGKSIAVLELGWERRSGSFPHTLFQCLGDMNISGTSAKNSNVSRWLSSAKPTRLFQLVLGDGQHAFVAHGLGGCSLINAGVFLEADERTLQMSPWPPEIRKHPSALRTYYSRAATMLQPSAYPEDHPRLNKLEHLREQSRWLGKGQSFYRVPLTTFFHGGRNNAGVAMQANSGSGHECTGLNDGSKNSVATTYLADAWNWGAEIFCGCEVRFVEKAPGKGYIVYFAWHGSGRSVFNEDFKEQLFWVKANELCFLAAGALGTTEILLRSKERGMQMSPLVGRNLSGNGDLLMFGYNSSANINGIAQSSSARSRPGPTITGAIDNRASHNPLAGYIIQDGCIPEPLNPIIQIMFILQTIGKHSLQLGKTIAALKSLLLGPYAHGGAIQRTSTYLVMSHDSNEITLTLKNGQLYLRAPAEGRSAHFKWIKAILSEVLGRSEANIGFSYFYGRHQEEITVHLLGGANMSRDGTGREGVTNHLGQVFTGHGSEVHEGLLCCDASIIPTALGTLYKFDGLARADRLGVNPLATISALAERSLSLITENSGLSIDLETKNGSLDACSKPKVSRSDHQLNNVNGSNETSQPIGWQFTELLRGHISVEPNIKSFALSETAGKGSSCALQMFLTVEICKRSKDIRGSRYEGICTGTVSCFALSRATLKVLSGTVDFFTQVEASAELTTISYHLQLISVEGTQYRLEGRKDIDSNIAFSIRKTWEATTTVNVSIARLDGTKVGAGALHISLPHFQKQMRTFRMTKDFNVGLLLSLMAFLISFTYHLSMFFFRPFVPVRFPHTGYTSDSKTLPSSSCKVIASDGVQTLLEIYDPLSPLDPLHPDSKHPPVLFLPGVTGIGAIHSVYALPFLSRNMVDYFTARGHRCYALVPRWGCDAATAEESTVFDCRLDVAAALEHINTREQQKPYVMAHCQGSVALGMGLLDGTIASSQVLGITANSVFMNQVFGYWNSLKGRTTLLIRLYELLAGTFFPVASSDRDSAFQRLLDALLRFYPFAHRRDVCTSTACRRTSFAFGLLWNHDNLDVHLHENVHEFFAGTHTKLLKHVVRMGTRGFCLDNQLRPLLTADNVQRLQGVPILFISGTENEVFNPESTLRDYELLRRRFGERLYRRFLAEGYGHLDPIVGKAAADDVYWRVGEHLGWCVKNVVLTKV
ncbi:hypothetical protein Aspvir_003134 [Aspergillus viridinutans]|uniref:Glucose-methanol-choline oxidoreductase N-terminal domain-containing protein n=1 Tax=Aspergillus viridinutans TaxID=75553 RepID=A0A9P3FA88_ASPVI|nr:uncharacterized protein Aspvir_003134 [Aspergillus viridinutans]GIK07468.1 hypothetical protein Aspvir_003134 [Aspergillus viridinutans]